VIVRAENHADRAAIHAVHAACFPTEEEARLVDALRDAGRLSISLVAEEGGEVVGHVAFSPVRIQGTPGPIDRAGDGLGLAPVAVLPAFRRRGIAQRLVRAGLEVAERDGHGLVVVLGDPGYYGRFGFRAASERGLRDEFGGGEAFQALELRPGSVPAGGGLVRYEAAFSAFADGD
jgi:putative acetyltransferase